MRTVEQLLALDNPDAFTWEQRCEIVEEADKHIDQMQGSITQMHPQCQAYASLRPQLESLQRKRQIFRLWASTTQRFGEVGLKRSA